MIDVDIQDAALRVYNFIPWLAIKHHKTHKNEYLNFKTHPYQKKIYFDKSKYLVIIKSTQNGVSEYLLVRAIGHAIQGMRVFYVLPTFELVKRFVDERYTKTTQNTSYYRMLVRAVKEIMDIKQTESVKSKDIGEGNIAFVNSGSSVGFTEYPADEVIIDELDKCDKTNIEMAWERLSASEYRWQTKISNPTYKNMGIDAEYEDTDQMEWFVPCPNGHKVRLDWFEHVVREINKDEYILRDKEWSWNSGKDIRPICDICDKPINRHGFGEWDATSESVKRGYRLTKLFTGTVSMIELYDRFQKGLKNDEILQRFYNADLGEGYIAKGKKISEEMLKACARDYRPGTEDGLILAGVDVGTWYHYIIVKLMPEGIMKTLCVGKERDTEELKRIIMEYKVNCFVVDAEPETREARKIANIKKLGFVCHIKNPKNDLIDIKRKSLTVSRTPSIDAVKELILTNTIIFPHSIVNDKEFVKNMTTCVRVYNSDKNKYDWIGKPDHWLMALAMCLIARRLIILLDRK